MMKNYDDIKAHRRSLHSIEISRATSKKQFLPSEKVSINNETRVVASSLEHEGVLC